VDRDPPLVSECGAGCGQHHRLLDGWFSGIGRDTPARLGSQTAR
jgi:hypothetical protein